MAFYDVFLGRVQLSGFSQTWTTGNPQLDASLDTNPDKVRIVEEISPFYPCLIYPCLIYPRLIGRCPYTHSFSYCTRRLPSLVICPLVDPPLNPPLTPPSLTAPLTIAEILLTLALAPKLTSHPILTAQFRLPNSDCPILTAALLAVPPLKSHVHARYR